jgi:hypothetical protein
MKMDMMVRPLDLFVSPAGDDRNDGSRETPFATVQKAADLVVPGTAVHVAPGVYAENVSIVRSGTAEAPVRFVSDVKWKASIRPNAFRSPVALDADHVVFEGFEVTGEYEYGIFVKGSHVQVLRNHIHGMAPHPWQNTNHGGAGIVTYRDDYQVDDILIEGNLIHDIGPRVYCNFIHGIYIATGGNRVVNNIVYNVSGWGIHGWHAVMDSVVANNLVFSCRRGGLVLGAGDSPGGVVTDRCTVVNNIFYQNIGYGGVEMGDTGLDMHYRNNLVFENTKRAFALQNGLKDEGTIEADPGFVEFLLSGKGDYHLVADSPCIGAGTALEAPERDFDGNLRPAGRDVDIGPYAYFEGTATTEGRLP